MKTLTFNKPVLTLMSVMMISLLMMSCSKENDLEKPMKLPDYEASSKTLNEVEKEGLLYMAEQEKMLQNVYESLYATHSVAVFAENSTSKEQQKQLLSAKIDRYGLDNPISEMEDGEYRNPFIQQTYDDIMAIDDMTAGDALIYSKTLEEAVISDLEYLISEENVNEDLANTYRQILETTHANLDALFFETKGLIDIALWYDPVKVYVPQIKGVRDIIKVWDPVKED